MTMTEANPFTQGQQLWNDFESHISRTARDLSRSFWKVDEEDIKQEIFLFLWSKEADLLSQERSDAYIKVCIYNVAQNYCLKQRNKMLLETETFYYSLDEVKTLLPSFLGTYDTWAKTLLPEGYETTTQNDNVEVMCDFALAWDRLKEPQQDILVRRYQADEDFSEAKDRQALSRATRRFTTVLNQNKDIEAKAHEGPGSRKAITNAQAQYEAKRQVSD